jgi:RNA polymerase sigma factor (sigma-70 family)
MRPPPTEQLATPLLAGLALRAQPDRRLVRLVQEGYEVAFEEIVRRYGKQLGRYAGAIVGGRSEDVTQDAFSKALIALRGGDAEIELRPWLYRIVRNTALNDLRDHPPAAEALAEGIPGGRGPSEQAEQRENLAELLSRLRALPEPQRAAIVMRELEGLGHEEIAAALGLSGGAARQAIHRARRALRDGLGILVPAPLLRSMLETAAVQPVEAAAGAAGAAGAGLALKAGAATVLFVGAVGGGVAIHAGSEATPPDASVRRAEKPTRPSSAGRSNPSWQLVTVKAESASSDGEADRRGNANRDDAGDGRRHRARGDDSGGDRDASHRHEGEAPDREAEDRSGSGRSASSGEEGESSGDSFEGADLERADHGGESTSDPPEGGEPVDSGGLDESGSETSGSGRETSGTSGDGGGSDDDDDA